jgi:hypothetical protein
MSESSSNGSNNICAPHQRKHHLTIASIRMYVTCALVFQAMNIEWSRVGWGITFTLQPESLVRQILYFNHVKRRLIFALSAQTKNHKGKVVLVLN